LSQPSEKHTPETRAAAPSRLLLLGFSPQDAEAIRLACEKEQSPRFQVFSRVPSDEQFNRLRTRDYHVAALNLANSGLDDLAYLMRLSGRCATVVVSAQSEAEVGWLRLVDVVLPTPQLTPERLLASAHEAAHRHRCFQAGLTTADALNSLQQVVGPADPVQTGVLILDERDRVIFANNAARALGETAVGGILSDLRRHAHVPEGHALLPVSDLLPQPLAVSALALEVRGRPLSILRVERADAHSPTEVLWRQLARLDPQTGLPTRDTFMEQLAQRLGESAAPGTRVGVLLLSVRLEQPADEPAWEGLRRRVADTLRDGVRTDDMVSRLDATTFAVLLANAPRAGDLGRLASKQRERVLALGFPGLSVNAGVACSPDDALGVTDLLRRADEALRSAPGSDGLAFAPTEPGRDAHRRWLLESRLPKALATGQLQVYYQPLVSAADGRICGAEALLRWSDPVLGNVPPGEFVGVAEALDLTSALGAYVMARALPELRKWRRARPDLRLSLNVSPRQMLAADFLRDFRQALERAGLPAEAVELEITEELMVGDSARARLVLGELEALGARVVLDDFGTGFSSLGYLMDLPVAGIKIDRLFSTGLPDSGTHVAMSLTIISLARHLKLELVAEGVETAAQARWMGEQGVPRLQGFLYSPAVPADDFEKLLTGQQFLPA